MLDSTGESSPAKGKAQCLTMKSFTGKNDAACSAATAPFAYKQKDTTSCPASTWPLDKSACKEFAISIGAYKENDPLKKCDGVCFEGAFNGPKGCIYQLSGADINWVAWNTIAAELAKPRDIYSPVCASSCPFGTKIDDKYCSPYTPGKASNGGYDCLNKDGSYSASGNWYGSLEAAKAKCDADFLCTVLHDYNADGKNWRVCKWVSYDKDNKAAILVKATAAEAFPPEQTGVSSCRKGKACVDRTAGGGATQAELNQCLTWTGLGGTWDSVVNCDCSHSLADVQSKCAKNGRKYICGPNCSPPGKRPGGLGALAVYEYENARDPEYAFPGDWVHVCECDEAVPAGKTKCPPLNSLSICEVKLKKCNSGRGTPPPRICHLQLYYQVLRGRPPIAPHMLCCMWPVQSRHAGPMWCQWPQGPRQSASVKSKTAASANRNPPTASVPRSTAGHATSN